MTSTRREEPTWVDVLYADSETGMDRLSRHTQWRRGTELIVAKDVKALRAEGFRGVSVRVRGIKFTPAAYQRMVAEHLERLPEEA